jgi:hypothetical protein
MTWREPSSAPTAISGSSAATSMSGVIRTNSMSSAPMPVSAIAAFVARSIGASSIRG